MTTNDLTAIFSYVRSQNIAIDIEEFKFQVETHPYYPSLLAFSDALTFFKIPNLGARVSKEEIEKLPESFVALLQEAHKEPFFSFVQKEDPLYTFSLEKGTKKVSVEELQNLWQHVILLVEKPSDFSAVENNGLFMKRLFFIGFSCAVLGLVYYFSTSILSLVFGLISIIGIFLSIEALKTELGIESKVSQSFCNVIPNADCGQVINSNKSTWLKNFKISDLSIWFFSSQLFLLLLFSVNGNVQNFFFYMLVGLGLSIPMTFYSAYFQYMIEKKWCPICLSIIALLYLQFAILFFNYPKVIFEAQSILLFVFGFSAIAAVVYFIKPLLLQLKDLREKNIKNLRFKRNYSFFKNNLVQNEQQFFENRIIVLGNPDAKLKISVVTSPFCGYCKEAHEILHRILERYQDSVAIDIRFNFEVSSAENSNQFYYRLVELYQDAGDLKFSEALKFHFETKNTDVWLSKYGNAIRDTKHTREVLLSVTNENKSKDLNFTPNIFINQFKFPNQYENKDLEYFVADLIDDEGIL